MKRMQALLVILMALNGFGQSSQNSKLGLYKWTEAVPIKPSDLNGTDVHRPEISSIPGQIFRVLRIKDGVAIIQVLDYTKGKTPGADKKEFAPGSNFYKYNFFGDTTDYKALSSDKANSRNYEGKQAYFKVDISLLDELAVKQTKVGGALTAGVINFPFKYRFQKDKSDFSGAFNFGAGIGYKFAHKVTRQFTWSILSGYSISNIVLDSSSSGKNQGKLASTNNFTAFSFSLGILAEYQQVQAGLFFGWDRISRLNQREFEWNYQGKPWISIGFGLAIFSSQKEKAEKNPSATQTGN